jgi:hypothetical protein
MRAQRVLARTAAIGAAVLLLSGCFTDGSYTIGSGKGQVKPGTWLAPGGASCSWSKAGPTAASGSGNGRQQVTVTAADTNFTTKGCGYWEEASAPLTFTGSGSQVTAPFDLTKGLVIATGTHAGERNFIVQLVDSKGDDVDLLANEIGDARSEVISNRPTGGSYRLEVQADGAWTVALTQPRSTGGRTLPTTFSGTGSAVAGPFFQNDRAVVFEAHHVGQRNFIVQLVKPGDIFGSLVANEIGDADVSSIERVSGSYWISVTADGPWTISAHY